MNTAMDSTAGERERRSLEVLLAQPARAFDILAGKWLATASLSVVGVTLELLASHAILRWMPLEEIGMSWRMGLGTMLGMCAIAVPLCLFAAAIEIALAMNAKTFKEAQATMGFAMLLPILPVVVIPNLNLDTALWMYLVPVLSNQTLLLELAKGNDIGVLPWLLTAGSSLLLALLAIGFASWRLKSEKYVLGV
jgi:sodium transport system permease protein